VGTRAGVETEGMNRANIGCGPIRPFGWDNFDVEVDHPAATCNVRYWDVTEPLITADYRLWDDYGNYYPDGRGRVTRVEGPVRHRYDYAVANHLLNHLAPGDVMRALSNIRETLKPGGTLRVMVPDLIRAISAYMRDEPDWFPLGDVVEGLDARFCTYITWHGTQRSVFTAALLAQQLETAGFSDVWRSPIGETFSHRPEITSLDDRGGESIIMEAVA
jgi:SAM-dependent methyltransferase